MSDTRQLETALRMACHELAAWRRIASPVREIISDTDVDDVVAEMLGKARGFEEEPA